MKNSRFGKKAEEKIARSLRGRGASVKHYEDSRGPGATDVEACWPKTGTCWFLQVKASRTTTEGDVAWPSADEINKLCRRAKRNNATAVVAQVEGGNIEYRSAQSGRRLPPPDGGNKK